MTYALIAHGGAGAWLAADEAAATRGLKLAAQRGAQLLAGGASALEAVAEVVRLLEDDPVFSAGTGSAPNADGEIELDAALMSGHDSRAGAVACLRRVRNPILVARAVMQHTNHVLLAGEGALRFARAHGFADYDPSVPAQRLAQPGGDTVGAVALDHDGNLAVAGSTGGTRGKLPGRIGDTPLLGAGLFATKRGAAAVTGHGEFAMRALTAATVCAHLARGVAAQAAVAAALAEAKTTLREEVRLGLIAIDARGRFGAAHSTAAMPHALCSSDFTGVRVRFRAD
jgi:beta-aspartyl-peptidase (threonine type)